MESGELGDGNDLLFCVARCLLEDRPLFDELKEHGRQEEDDLIAIDSHLCLDEAVQVSCIDQFHFYFLFPLTAWLNDA